MPIIIFTVFSYLGLPHNHNAGISLSKHKELNNYLEEYHFTKKQYPGNFKELFIFIRNKEALPGDYFSLMDDVQNTQLIDATTIKVDFKTKWLWNKGKFFLYLSIKAF